jgi:outer membrane protein
MKRLLSAATLTLALALAATPAHAGNPDGKIQLKLLGTAVLPDGKITRVKFDGIGLPATTQTAADDNFTPTIAAEYFVSPNFSLETICCVTQHDVTGRGGLAGAGLVSNANIVPATLTAKLHFPVGGVKPYVGAGPTYFIFINEKPGATTRTLGATRQQLNDKLGFALQAGVDIPVNSNGMGVSIDAKRYFVSTDARWFAGNTLVLHTRHKLDPWVVSAGLSWRF